METKVPIKKLFRVALFTSTAIGLITIAPVYVMTFSIAEVLAPDKIASILKLSPFSPITLSLLATIFLTILIFTFWTINILLTYTLEKYSLTRKIKIPHQQCNLHFNLYPDSYYTTVYQFSILPADAEPENVSYFPASDPLL